MSNARVYSYLRFSDPRQRAGSSIDRQTAYAAQWAAEHGLTLDTSLNLRDEGLSAYHRQNVTRGALGTFFKAIDTGLVPRGSVLVVESLDRLSRADVDIALKQLLDIIHAGITVVTVADNAKEYSSASVRRNPVDLIVSITVMMRAHEESHTKSRRVTAALRRQCLGWNAGTWRGQLSAGKDPRWIRYNPERRAFELDPGEAESMRVLIGLYREGHGPARAFALMHERGIAIPESVSNTGRMHAIMGNGNLIGEKTVEVDGETFVLPGYYPPLLTQAEFASLQFLRGQRGRRAGKSEVVSIMTGIGITCCAHCGFAMANQNVMDRSRKENGLPQDGHRRLMCTGAQNSANRCRAGSCSIVPAEHALMAFCSDQMNLASLFVDSDEKSHTLNEGLALARQAVTDTERQIDWVLDAAASDESETPASMKKFLRKLEDRLAAEKLKVSGYEHDLEALHRHSQPAVAEVWDELREGVEMLDSTARTKARQLVADTFARIEVSLASPDMIGLRLVSKRDIVRILWIDRKTGERRDQVTIENTAHAALAKTPRGLKRAA